MNVLITGAFGNIGRSAVDEIIKQDHRVRCFDLKTKANEKAAGKLKTRAEVVWGDLGNPEDICKAVQDQDIVIHLAFVIPTFSTTGIGSEDQPDWAAEINIGGTKNLIESMKALKRLPKIIFSSSLHVYGITTDQDPPRSVDDPLKPVEHYARHKVACERIVKDSGLMWSIFRFAAALPFSLKLDRAMFEVPLDNRIEFIHNRDVGLALANAVNSEQIWGKILHIGGGSRCRYLYRDFVEKVLAAVGLTMLPEEAFSKKPFSTDWLDTAESQSILKYQRYTLTDFTEELSGKMGFKRHLVPFVRPLVRSLLLKKSPYFEDSQSRGAEEMRGKTALVTCGSSSFGEATSRKLAQEGLSLILIEKPDEDLDNLVYMIREEGGDVRKISADLFGKDDIDRLIRDIRHNCGGVDILINHTDLEMIPGEKIRQKVWRKIEQNVIGVIRMTERILVGMKAANRGQIITVEPAVRLFPVKPRAIIHSLRDFFKTYAVYLEKELRGTNIRTSLIRSGIATTELFRIASTRSVTKGHGFEVRPEALANRVWKLIIQPRRVIYVPQFMALISWLERYAGWLVELIKKKIFPLRKPDFV